MVANDSDTSYINFIENFPIGPLRERACYLLEEIFNNPKRFPYQEQTLCLVSYALKNFKTEMIFSKFLDALSEFIDCKDRPELSVMPQWTKEDIAATAKLAIEFVQYLELYHHQF